MRIKIGPFTDFNMTKSMDTRGRRVAGMVHESGFSGQFAMQKQ